MKKLFYILLAVSLIGCEKSDTEPMNIEEYLADRMIYEIEANPSRTKVFFLSAVIDENAPPYLCSLPLIYQLSCTDINNTIYLENLHHIHQIAVDNANNVYSCKGINLMKFMPSHDSITIKQISSGFSSVAINDEGNIWAGTWDDGLYKYSENSWVQFTAENSLLPEGDISEICCGNDNIVWAHVTNENGYILRIADNDWKVFQYDRPSGDYYIYLNSFNADKNGNAYLSYNQNSKSYLIRIDENGITNIPLSLVMQNKNLNSLEFDNDGNLYFVNNQQDFSEIWRLKSNQWEQVHIDNNISHIYDIAIDNQDILWIGTNKGVKKRYLSD